MEIYLNFYLAGIHTLECMYIQNIKAVVELDISLYNLYTVQDKGLQMNCIPNVGGNVQKGVFSLFSFYLVAHREVHFPDFYMLP